MAASARSALGGVAGVAMIFWVALYSNEVRWETEEDDGLQRSVRAERSGTPLPTSGGRQPLTDADKEYLRRFGTAKLWKTFQPILTEDEKKQIMHAMKLLTDALDRAGIDYFLYGGSMIGSWRHHDIVPWDDDLDIVVNISSFEKLEGIKIPGHTLNIRTLNRYKFYSNNATHVPLYFWKWPYIDICFYGDNGTHLYDMDPAFSKTFVYDKKDVLPLVRRPFGNLNLKAPKNIKKTIAQNYDIDVCQTRRYNHKRQKGLASKDIVSVDCRLLYRIYPFVIRSSANLHSSVENVYLNGKLISSVDVHVLH